MSNCDGPRGHVASGVMDAMGPVSTVTNVCRECGTRFHRRHDGRIETAPARKGWQARIERNDARVAAEQAQARDVARRSTARFGAIFDAHARGQ